VELEVRLIAIAVADVADLDQATRVPAEMNRTGEDAEGGVALSFLMMRCVASFSSAAF
jgi:hypothetical protein